MATIRRRPEGVAQALAALLLSSVGFSASAMPLALKLECAGQTSIELQAGTIQTRTIAAGADTRDLILTEQGADVLVAVNGGAFAHIAYPMTRHAWKHLELAPNTALQLGFKLAQASFGSVTLGADCTTLEPERKRWLQSADQLAESVNAFVQSSPQLSAFDQLVAQARNSEDRAAALHMRAAALMLLDRYPESAVAYAQVAVLWRQLGRPIQEAGALIGQANLLIMSGQGPQALAPARAAERLLNPARQPYLMTRALAVRCQVQQLSGQPGAAMRCHEDLVKRYLALGDRTEALMSAINAAYAVRDSGERRRANRLLDNLSADADRPEISAETRARLSMVRAYLHRDQGELIAALAEFANALRLFEQSTENRVARQAHTMLQIADIYAQLGLSDQAYRLLTHSLGLYNAASAPARVAAALMKLALIDRGVGRSEQAAVWFDRAERIYQLQGMPIEQAEAALGALESRMPQSAEAAQAEFRRVRDFSRLSAANRSRLELLQIRWLIIAGRHDEAERRLRVAEQGRAPVPQRLMATRLRAELLHRDGEDEQALDLIERRLQSIIALANQAHRGTLGYLTVRSARELREDWVSIALATTPMPDPTRWWSVLADSAPLQATDPGEHSGASNDFGAVLAAELLGSDSGGTDRALLTALAPAETPAARKSDRRALPDLLALRRSLGDAWLLVIVPAEPSSAALWIGPDREVVVPIPGRSVLREQIRMLTADLATPQVAVAAIDRSASTLSASLFAGAPEAAAPARLYLFGDDLIGTVPLTLLHWPGATAPLIDTTATGWITRVESRDSAPQASISRLRAVVAPGNSATLKAGMATLRYADAEPDLIARTLPQITLERATGAAATPKALVDALSDPQAWVHLAAHGYARPQLLGYAGAWLASPDNPERSVMLSWLDVIDTPLHAPLAVLNACQLAAGPGATSQSSLSFASAVSAAGVDHVVAAYWPISDSASAVWIPAFYAAMRDQPAAHAMDALRTAQIALKDSRAFRHPYYWASLTYFRRLTVER